jgi:hypothetical protein
MATTVFIEAGSNFLVMVYFQPESRSVLILPQNDSPLLIKVVFPETLWNCDSNAIFILVDRGDCCACATSRDLQ